MAGELGEQSSKTWEYEAQKGGREMKVHVCERETRGKETETEKEALCKFP